MTGKAIEIRPDHAGLVFAICPRCGTPGTKFKPVPGVQIRQQCPRRDCKHVYEIIVWPDLYRLAGGLRDLLGLDGGED